jgi:fatty acid desaturase
VPTSSAPGAETSPDATPGTPDGRQYAELSRLVRQAGLLRRRRPWYTWKIAGTAAAFAAGWAAFALLGDSWWQLVVAVALAVVFAHRQIFATSRPNYLLGVACGNLAIGLSYGWWVAKHNRHHAHPNTEDEDPDIMISVLAFSAGQARAAAGLRRLIVRYQAYLLIPMLFLEAAGLHGSSIRALTTRGPRSARAARRRGWEAGLLAVHVAAYLSAVFLVLSPVRAVVFILIQQGLFGFYLGCAFAPNHKGMPVLGGGETVGFLHRQVLTSRNVRGGWLTDAALGGLNYQIEHHLFPSMPRPNLRYAQPLVAAFCADNGLSYTQTTLLGSYAQAVRHLNAVGKAERPAAAVPAPSPPARPAAPHPAIPATGKDRGLFRPASRCGLRWQSHGYSAPCAQPASCAYHDAGFCRGSVFPSPRR